MDLKLMALQKPLLLAILCLLAACQPDNKPVTVSLAPTGEKLAPPSSDDRQDLFSYSFRRSMKQARPVDGKLVINVDTATQQVSGLGNPLRIVLTADGKPWQVTKRMPVTGDGMAVFGATAESEVYKGFTGDIRAFASLSGTPLEEEVFELAVKKKQAFPTDPNWQRPEAILGNLRRVNGDEVLYALYRTPLLGERDCVLFQQSAPMVRLQGDICAPIGQKMGRARAEAIIRGIGIDPVIPVEAVPNISSLPAD
jgi:hypothetical protein